MKGEPSRCPGRKTRVTHCPSCCVAEFNTFKRRLTERPLHSITVAVASFNHAAPPVKAQQKACERGPDHCAGPYSTTLSTCLTVEPHLVHCTRLELLIHMALLWTPATHVKTIVGIIIDTDCIWREKGTRVSASCRIVAFR